MGLAKFVICALAISISFKVYILVYIQSQQYANQQLSKGFNSDFNKAVKTENSAVYVVLEDQFIESKDEPRQIQKFMTFLKAAGTKYSKIVLNVTHCGFQRQKIKTAILFLQTLFIDNKVRSYLGLEQFKLYFFLSPKIFLNSDDNLTCWDTACFDAFLYNYLTYSRTISGVIVDSSLILNSFHKTGDISAAKTNGIWTRILKAKDFTRKLFGQELKVGMFINSYKECVSILKDLPKHVISKLDIAVYIGQRSKWVGASVEIMKSGNDEMHFAACHQIFIRNISYPLLYHLNMVLF